MIKLTNLDTFSFKVDYVRGQIGRSPGPGGSTEAELSYMYDSMRE